MRSSLLGSGKVGAWQDRELLPGQLWFSRCDVRRRRQSRHQHQAADAAGIDAERAVALVTRRLLLAVDFAVARDRPGNRRSRSRSACNAEGPDQPGERNDVGGRKRDDAPP